LRAAPPGKRQTIPTKKAFVTLPDQTIHLGCGVHCLTSEANFLLETLQAPMVLRATESLQAIPEHAVQDIRSGILRYPTVLQSPNRDWNLFLTIGVDADARRISQALTEPEYLEAWITMPGEEGESSIVASKKVNGYRLDQYRAGRIISSFVGSFLFCHQRKMRLTWRNAACPGVAESLVDFRIRGNFGGSILELRHVAIPSADDFLWHQQLWGASLPRLASILRSA
jgi:hypothetical protein